MNLREDILSSNEYTINISKEVFTDVDNILIWYDLYSEELPKEFYKYLMLGFKNILNNPKSYQKIFKNIRRCLIKKFPYSIIYKIDERNYQIVIISVIHNSRSPKIWKEE